MPGLCGIVHPDASRSTAVLGGMLDHLSRFEWHAASRMDLAGASLGHVSVIPAGGSAVSGLALAGGIHVVFDGELYGPSSLPAGDSLPARVAAGLFAGGPSLFEHYHGCFACAVWDPASHRVSIATDRFGMRPVYWTRTADGFLFASEPGALLRVEGVSDASDEAGLAQFLAFGQLLGDRTLHADVRVVPPGCWLTFDADAGTVTVQSYAGTTEPDAPRADAEWLDLVDDRAVAAVARAFQDAGALGLSLSGGLDARTILGLAPSGAKLTCVSLGIPGSIDHRAAGTLARLAGQPHHELMLDGDFLGRFEDQLRAMVRLTDGQYVDQGIVLSTLPVYRDLGIQTLLRGHAGELMHMSKAYAFSVDAAALRLGSTPELTDWLWRHLTGYMIGGVEPALFTGRFAGRLRDIARASLEQQVAAWDHVEPVPQRIWRLFVAERLRRETAVSLQLFRNFVEVRVPFLDPGLIEVLLAAPPHLKVRDELQTFMLRRHRPEFLGVVNANTGAPMGAGPLRTRLTTFRMKVYGRLGVPGYQPYERLGLWLARDLEPMVRRLLLSEGSVAHELFTPEAVSALMAQHRARTHNHTFLLMALVILEMGRRDADRGRGCAGRDVA